MEWIRGTSPPHEDSTAPCWNPCGVLPERRWPSVSFGASVAHRKAFALPILIEEYLKPRRQRSGDLASAIPNGRGQAITSQNVSRWTENNGSRKRFRSTPNTVSQLGIKAAAIPLDTFAWNDQRLKKIASQIPAA